MIRKQSLLTVLCLLAMLASLSVFAAKTTPPILVATPTVADVTTATADYSLAVGSPLIDVGTNTSGDTAPLDFTTDVIGNTRGS